MANLNLSFDELASVICLAIHLGTADDEFSDQEGKAIIDALTDQYNFEGKTDLFKQYWDKACKMDPEDAIRHLQSFGPAEKQWASNFFAKVIVADDNLEESEKDLYWHIQNVCDLPDNNLSGDDSNSSNFTEGEVFPIIRYRKVNGSIYDGLVEYLQLSSNVRNNIFTYFGDPETLTFFRVSEPLTKLRSLMDLDVENRLILIYCQDKFLSKLVPNKTASLLTAEDVNSPLLFAIEDREKGLHGFSSPEQVKQLLRSLRSLCGASFMIDGERNEALSDRYLHLALTELGDIQ